MILVVDNYDSFTFNIVQALGGLGADVHVVKNDQVGVRDVESMGPAGLVISPGPGRPADAGISAEVVRHFLGRVPLLGVCLGHQVLCEVLGASVVAADAPYHGRTSCIHHDGRGLFEGVPDGFRAARYHSLVVDPRSLPRDLRPTAYAHTGELMGVRHVRCLAEGLQFHPESFMTEHGLRVIEHFVRMTGAGPCALAAKTGFAPSLGSCRV